MKRSILLLLCGIVGLVVLFLMNIFFGSVHIAVADVVDVLCGNSDDSAVEFIVLQHRLPQALTALFVGASLAVAGLLLQTSFHNPLAGPSVLGISGGASLGVAIVMLGASLFGFSVMPVSVVLAAFLGAIAVTALLLFLSTLLNNNVVLLIVGLLLGYLISAVITILNVSASAEGLQNYIVWGMGDFSSITLQQLPLFVGVMFLLIVGTVLMIKPLNALQLGDMYAENLGINLKKTRNMMLLFVGGITAITTAYCGPISFIGLAVPHIARMIFGTGNFRSLLPATLVCGCIVALLCNLLSTIPTGTVLPLNAVTPLIGVPVIVYVILKRK